MILLLVLVAWLLLAAGLGVSGQLQNLRPPGPQLILLGLTTGLLFLWWLNRSARACINRVDLRATVGLHLTRFVGLYFLYLCGQGELPREFAVPAGWGDTAVATGAAVSLIFWSSFGSKRPWLMVWNTLGSCRHHLCRCISCPDWYGKPQRDGRAPAIPAKSAAHVFGPAHYR